MCCHLSFSICDIKHHACCSLPQGVNACRDASISCLIPKTCLIPNCQAPRYEPTWLSDAMSSPFPSLSRSSHCSRVVALAFQDDWAAYSKMTAAMTNTQIVGDDLLVTNVDRIKTAIEKKVRACASMRRRASMHACMHVSCVGAHDAVLLARMSLH